MAANAMTKVIVNLRRTALGHYVAGLTDAELYLGETPGPTH
jgi:hypothetical protein